MTKMERKHKFNSNCSCAHCQKEKNYWTQIYESYEILFRKIIKRGPRGAWDEDFIRSWANSPDRKKLIEWKNWI